MCRLYVNYVTALPTTNHISCPYKPRRKPDKNAIFIIKYMYFSPLCISHLYSCLSCYMHVNFRSRHQVGGLLIFPCLVQSSVLRFMVASFQEWWRQRWVTLMGGKSPVRGPDPAHEGLASVPPPCSAIT